MCIRDRTYVDEEGNIFEPTVNDNGSVQTNTPDGVEQLALVDDEGNLSAAYVGPSQQAIAEEAAEEAAEFADAVEYTAERATAIADAIDQGNAEDAIEIAELAVAETQAAVDVRDALSEQVSIDSAIQEGLEDLDAAQQVADAAA